MRMRIIIIIGIVFVLYAIVLLFVLSGAFAVFMPNPPEPEIKYGEFPFVITYEINGEIKTIEDVIVCKYDGIESLGTAGKYRKWSASLKSGKKRVVLLDNSDDNLHFQITTNVGLDIPGYYMGDSRFNSKEDYQRMLSDDRYLGYIQWKNGKEFSNTITREDAYEEFGIRVISFEPSDPIENTFE